MKIEVTGGPYHEAFKTAIDSLGRLPTVDYVLRLREYIVAFFNIGKYMP